MKIERHYVPRSTLEAFADLHGLTMEIHERQPCDLGKRWTENSRYYAHFTGCETRENGCLVAEFGNGATPDEAMSAYAQAISGKRLVWRATSSVDRREFYVPVLTHEVAP